MSNGGDQAFDDDRDDDPGGGDADVDDTFPYEPLDLDDITPHAPTLSVYTDPDADFGRVADPDGLSWNAVRKRPVQVEAIQMGHPFEVETLEGTMEGDAGHYLVRGVEGELYPVEPDIFDQTYAAGDDDVPVYSKSDVEQAIQAVMTHADVNFDDASRSAFTKFGAEAVHDALQRDLDADDVVDHDLGVDPDGDQLDVDDDDGDGDDDVGGD